MFLSSMIEIILKFVVFLSSMIEIILKCVDVFKFYDRNHY